MFSHLQNEHSLDNRPATNQTRIQLQIVAQLETTLQKEVDRLQVRTYKCSITKLSKLISTCLVVVLLILIVLLILDSIHWNMRSWYCDTRYINTWYYNTWYIVFIGSCFRCFIYSLWCLRVRTPKNLPFGACLQLSPISSKEVKPYRCPISNWL